MYAGGISFCLLYGIVLVRCQITEYHYINLLKSWKDAQQHCRDYYTDLATLQTIQDAHRVPIPTNTLDWAWIGLFDDPVSWRGTMTADSNSWKWSATGTQSPGGFQNWASGDPNNYAGGEHCVFIQNVGWKDYFCTGTVKFICYTVNSSGIKEYFLINTGMNWASAQAHCRQNYHDLALIETPAESQTVLDLVSNAATTAWIGLFRQPRRWSDGNPSTYTNWLPGQPNGAGDCFVLRSDYYWDDANCGIQKQFVCQKVFKHARVQAKITLKTTADVTDPAIENMFLKVLGDILEGNDISLRWIIPPKRVEEKMGTPVCP